MFLNPIQARALFADALQHGYAILAVNADSPAAITDCFEVARQTDSPLIVETSLWQLTGHSFGAGDPILGLGRYLAQVGLLANSERYSDCPILFHTDHIKGPETLAILAAAILGIPFQANDSAPLLQASTISLDSSELSEQENISHIQELCRIAQAANRPVTLEMEAGVDDGLTPSEVTRRLLGAVEVQYPGNIYLWAPGLGTRHGFSAEGYPEFSPTTVRQQQELASTILNRPIGIALHGSSGLSEEMLRAAVAAGVAKVNWSSESLLLRSSAAREFYLSHTQQLEKKHPDFKKTAMDNGVQSFISERYLPALIKRIECLNSAGQGKRFLKDKV